VIQSNYSAFMAPFFRKLSDDQLARIHAASLEILERTGVQLHHPRALELLRRAGAAVGEDGWVRIPAQRVEWALRAAPPGRTATANA
jgi:trimethylamine--corrinoid protein Co-methyltransferase